MPCDEKKKSMWYHGCEGSQKICFQCGQSVCEYHGITNNGGLKSGHSNCGGKECETSGIYQHMCRGHMKKCGDCGFIYCSYHSKAVSNAAVPKGGHVCNTTTGGRTVNMAVGIGKTVFGGGDGGQFNPFLRMKYTAAQKRIQRLGITPQRAACSVLDLARMANCVYTLHDNTTVRDIDGNGYTELTKNGWTVAEQDQQLHYQGEYPNQVAWAMFTKGKIAVLAHKGTTPNFGSDLHLDVASIIGGAPPVEPLLVSARIVKRFQNGGWDVMVTGHSLGGYMAEVVATNLGLSGIGFCAPGSGWHAGPHGGEGKGFQNINFENDRCGNVLPGIYQHPQWSVYVQDIGKNMHDMKVMMECMGKSGRNGWTNLNVISKTNGKPTGYYTNM